MKSNSLTSIDHKILNAEDPKILADNIIFSKILRKPGAPNLCIYFDTPGYIYMLRGWGTPFQDGEINTELFKQNSMLVYALAYANRLGKIHILPPHAEELKVKLLSNQFFPDALPETDKHYRAIFWNGINLNIEDKNLKSSRFVKALQSDCVPIFKGMFYAADNGFWKLRYKYLVRDKEIISIPSNTHNSFANLTDHYLFRPILQYLNKIRNADFLRPNNYIDAIALCLLDNKLLEFKNTQNESGTPLPLFFSHEKHILQAVEHFSDPENKPHNLPEDHIPFTYKEDSSKQDFVIVRDADFFILHGIYSGIQASGFSNVLSEYHAFVDDLIDSNEVISNSKPQEISSKSEITDSAQALLRARLSDSSIENILFSFFQEWWKKEGSEALVMLRDQSLIEQNNSVEIENYINEEINKFKNQNLGLGDRILTIRRIWKRFAKFPTFIKANFTESSQSLDINKEIGARLNYSQEACIEAQEYIDIFLRATFYKPSEVDLQDLLEAKTNIVNGLASGLFDDLSRLGFAPSPNVEEKNYLKLKQLSIGLAVLWTFEEYSLINDVCNAIFERYKAVDPSDTSDKYPSPSIALLHAAAILTGGLPNQGHTLLILDCVSKKFSENNYKVWLGLSYIHISIWRSAGVGFSCPEWHYYRFHELNFEPPFRDHLNEALVLSKKAYDWLMNNEPMNNKDDLNNLDLRRMNFDKRRERMTKLLYAQNNYLFVLSISGNTSDFLSSQALIESFQEKSILREAWHSSRYADTLACYFLRKSFFCKTKSEFERTINLAFSQSTKSMDGMIKPNNAFEQVHLKILEIQELGFENLKLKMKSYWDATSARLNKAD